MCAFERYNRDFEVVIIKFEDLVHGFKICRTHEIFPY